jgi:hypothetical protein
MPVLGISDLGTNSIENTIFAGAHDNMQVANIVIVSGQNLTRGTLLGKITASSKYKKLDTSAVDGSETLVGILGIATNATAGDEKAYMFVHGEFNRAQLNSTQAVTAGSFNSGAIVIKEEY